MERLTTGTLPIAHARGNRDDVFENAAQFAADDIVVGINAKQPAMEYFLQFFDDRLIGHRDNTGCCVAGHDLSRQVRSGQYAGRMSGQHVLNDFGHAHVRIELQSFGKTDHRHPWADMIFDLLEDMAKTLRRNANNNDIDAGNRFFYISRCEQVFGELRIRQELGVRVQRVDLLNTGRVSRP